jgi:OOP family OmpA-OmpF porin
MKYSTWTTLLGLVVVATTASAEGMYITGEVSRTQDAMNRGYFDNSLATAGAAGVASSAAGHGTQWRVQGGYRINPNLAIEAGYIDFGKSSYTATYAGGTAQGTLKAGGADVAGLALWPIDTKFTLFGKAGIVAASVKSSYSAATLASLPVANTSATVVRPLLGLGALYKLTDKIDLRTEFDHVSRLGTSAKTGTMNANMFSMGIGYNF